MNSDTLVAIFGVLALLSVGAWSALKPRFTRRKVHDSWPSRPLPQATQADIERVVRRDFPAEQYSDVMATLGGLDSRWEGVRVRLAALKLAEGNMEALKKQIAIANRDFRDVLVAAEYPGRWKVTSTFYDLPKKVSKKERQRIVDADWQQYQSWLRR
jgi:hypothetical protein